ncbi:MAG: UDP-N-acetylmuramoyl-L-alanyl-D-glutamate--2,6-diaminopimelate ligase [Lachnospiraceae bacterium]|nr:UDP-N-acetylmuramoyl-L-alanyl-D-glutamate--2,6-diaminopimelate ligase [Lachnospiraceae bacterium]
MNKTLKDYVNVLSEANLIRMSSIYEENEQIKNITFDSQKVINNTMFICKGRSFKKEYLQEAASRGAVCYISEKYYAGISLPYILVNDIRQAMPSLAKEFYDFDSSTLHTIGITGTKGKTTTSYYIKAILDEYMTSHHQKKTALISSIKTYDGLSFADSVMTTPEAIDVYQHMHNAASTGISHMTIEVSSQALKYSRVKGITFDTGVFLNISEDHIGPLEHKDFDDYFHAKLSIFRQTKNACVNIDSDYTEEILNAAGACQNIITFGMGEGADIQGSNIQIQNDRISFDVTCSLFQTTIHLAMDGLFNVENALAAIAVAYLHKIPVEYIVKGLEKTVVAGRMEKFKSKRNNISVIVDYAHNYLSFKKLYESVRLEYPSCSIISVFGCPGNKAYNRRKDLGTIAARFSDKVYLSTDDPGTESAAEIAKEIGKYIKQSDTAYEYIENREKAIRSAIRNATNNTVILILGKGNEKYQKCGQKLCCYQTDSAIAQKYLSENPL